jgi:hypothetical protein
MTNKSYAIATSLIRIGMLAAQIATSPSAAAQPAAAVGSEGPALMDRQIEIALALSACPSTSPGNRGNNDKVRYAVPKALSMTLQPCGDGDCAEPINRAGGAAGLSRVHWSG